MHFNFTLVVEILNHKFLMHFIQIALIIKYSHFSRMKENTFENYLILFFSIRRFEKKFIRKSKIN